MRERLSVLVFCSLLGALGSSLSARADTTTGAGERGPQVLTDACAALSSTRIETILRDTFNARGTPWSDIELRVACQSDAYHVTLTNRQSGQAVEQAIFAADAQPQADHDLWLARVLLDLIATEFAVPLPTPATQVVKSTAPTPESPRATPPTLGEALGPGHLGLRATMRWLNLWDANRIGGLTAQGALWRGPRWGIFAALGLEHVEHKRSGADVDMTLFHVGAGTTLRQRLNPSLSLESEFGLALVNANLTRRHPGLATIVEQRSGLGLRADLNFIMVFHYRDTRFTVGPLLGWLAGTPDSAPTYTTPELDSAVIQARRVRLAGPFLGFLAQVGVAF